VISRPETVVIVACNSGEFSVKSIGVTLAKAEPEQLITKAINNTIEWNLVCIILRV
jgi:hypothetical protein